MKKDNQAILIRTLCLLFFFKFETQVLIIVSKYYDSRTEYVHCNPIRVYHSLVNVRTVVTPFRVQDCKTIYSRRFNYRLGKLNGKTKQSTKEAVAER